MADAPPKRRLPVLPSTGPSEEEPRPAWHAIVTTALAMLFAWILLAWIANAAMGARVRQGGADVLVSLVNLGVFSVSGVLAGVLTGRTAPHATRRHAMLGGVATALLGWSVPFAWVVAAGTTLAAFVAWLAVLSAMVAVAASSVALGLRLARPRAPRAA